MWMLDRKAIVCISMIGYSRIFRVPPYTEKVQNIFCGKVCGYSFTPDAKIKLELRLYNRIGPFDISSTLENATQVQSHVYTKLFHWVYMFRINFHALRYSRNSIMISIQQPVHLKVGRICL